MATLKLFSTKMSDREIFIEIYTNLYVIFEHVNGPFLDFL
jgi:hypothetical protein